MAENYDGLLRLCGFEDEEIEKERSRVAKVFPKAGVGLEDIKRIYSHPQGLMQCEEFLKQYPAIEQTPAYDTAGSVKIIKEKGYRDAAAIASREAAE